MEKFVGFVLKKRNIWVHIIMTYFTIGLWVFVYFYIKRHEEAALSKKMESTNEKQNELLTATNINVQTKRKDYLYKNQFNIAGTTFDNRQLLIQQVIKEGLETEYLVKYDGITNKEIKENYDENVGEFHGQLIKKIKLVKSKYKNEDCIEVYIGIHSPSYMVGYVPKSELIDLLPIVDEPNLIIYAQIIGGNFKSYDIDEDKIVTKKLTYGIELTIALEKSE